MSRGFKLEIVLICVAIVLFALIFVYDAYFSLDNSSIEISSELSTTQSSTITTTHLSKEKSLNKEININTASLGELESLDGIGEKIAQNIIDYRKKGRFNSIEQIMNVSGIGEKKYNNIKNYITVN